MRREKDYFWITLLLLRVITLYVREKRLLGEISKNFWEFDWVRAHHLMTCYYALLRVITCYIWREKDYSVKFLRISGNLIGITRYSRYYLLLHYPLLPVMWREKDYSVKFLRISGNLIGYARIIL